MSFKYPFDSFDFTEFVMYFTTCGKTVIILRAA